jgi:hypothetical protein
MVAPSRSMARSAHHGGIVYWQSRRTRRASPQMSPAALVMIALALIGGVSLAAQLTGVLRLTGPLALAPAALVIGALNGPLVAATRAALRWLGG